VACATRFFEGLVKLELHCHSTYSDGSHPPETVARMAQERGAELFCLTDHDTVAGYEATTRALPETPTLRGLELSCHAYDRSVHVLMYAIPDGPGLGELEARLDRIADARRERIRAICARLERLGVALDAEAVITRTRGKTAGRPDVAHALVEAKIVAHVGEAFARFLRDDGPAYVSGPKLPLEEAIALGHRAGARMSVAHPHAVGDLALVRDMFARHRAHGLEGLEAHYRSYGPAEREPWLRLAAELDLVVTGGSDFHGQLLPQVTRPVIDLPDPHAARLLDWLGLR
jgi:predicted metal-dependent phosphoesterase TrpH